MSINKTDLDNHITGHWGEDQPMGDFVLKDAPAITMHKAPFMGRAEYDIDVADEQHRIRVFRQSDGSWTSYIDGEIVHEFSRSPIFALAQALIRLDADIHSD